MDYKICRICQDDSNQNDLIKPCKCSNEDKYVHRKCLDLWRIYSPNPESLYTCDVCGTNYIFMSTYKS